MATDEQVRQLAIKRLKDKNDFRIHLLMYLTVNAMLIGLWAWLGGIVATASGFDFGFFWPIFPIVGWGVGIIGHAYSVYFSNSYSEDEIRREMAKIAR